MIKLKGILISGCLAVFASGCASSQDPYRKLHSQVLALYTDPTLLTRADYEAAVAQRFRVRRYTESGFDVRPPKSNDPAYINFDLNPLWVPDDAFYSTYLDFTETVRADAERLLGPPLVVDDRGDSYWALTTGILIAHRGPHLQGMTLHPSRNPQLADFVEVPGTPSVPTRDETSAHLATIKIPDSGFTRYPQSATQVWFWNRETRESFTVGRWLRGPEAIYVSYSVGQPRESGVSTLMDLLSQLGVGAHRGAIEAALKRVVRLERVDPFSIDNIAYEIANEPSGPADWRSISVVACERENAPEREAQFGKPCSRPHWR